MKALKVISVVLFLAVVLLFPVRSSMADCEVPLFQNYIQVNPHAQGTRVPGTVTIYYERLYDKKGRLLTCSTGSYKVNMYYFIRLMVGGEPQGFSGRELNTELNPMCLGDFAKQVAIIQYLINQAAPGAVLRSYTNPAQDDQLFPGCSTSPCPFFFMMDIELAVP